LNRSELGWRGQKSEISDQRAAVFVELRRAREVSVVGVRFSQIYSDLLRFGQVAVARPVEAKNFLRFG